MKKKSATHTTKHKGTSKHAATAKHKAHEEHLAHAAHEAHLAHEGKVTAVARPAKPKKPAKARSLTPGDVGCCAAEALAASLRLCGGAVADGDVLDLFWRAGGDPVAGAPIWRVLEAASAGGLAGYRLAGFDLIGQGEEPCADAPCVCRRCREVVVTRVEREQLALPVHPFVDLGDVLSRRQHGLILGLELPGPHAVLATADGWWSWGELHDPAEWPDAAAEEAWAISWVVA